jgi:hypothetical protein
MIPTTMSLAGKRVETDVTPAGTGLPGAAAPSSPAPSPSPSPRPAAKPAATAAPRVEAKRPPTKPLAAAAPKSIQPGAARPAAPSGGYTDRPGVDSTADPATVLPSPIIPKF